tara:strand:+ start:1885 stop:2355 length:471 start_codon:yes stop_codon:yes gene_type:complete
MNNAPPTITWRWRHFDNFDVRDWHKVLQLRAKVFVVEQNCPYLDPDNKDPGSWHLEAFIEDATIGTLRAVPPGISYADSSIGRVVLDPDYRGLQLGRALMLRGIAFNRSMWDTDIRISGQAYLAPFYHSLGFSTVRGPYQEDDIPHFEMVLPRDIP